MKCSVLEPEIGCTKGPCFSPDDRTFYCADSVSRTIFAYDLTSGPARFRTSASSPRPRVSAECPTARRSMPTGICGRQLPAAGNSSAIKPTARSRAGSTDLNRVPDLRLLDLTAEIYQRQHQAVGVDPATVSECHHCSPAVAPERAGDAAGLLGPGVAEPQESRFTITASLF